MADRIGIIGAGGIGAYIAAHLIDAGEDVAIVARGTQRDAIAQNGVILVENGNRRQCTPAWVGPDMAALADCALVVVAVKAHQLADAIRDAAPHIADDALLLPFQNGVDATDMLCASFGAERSLTGVARIFANITAPGVVTQYGTLKTFIFGDHLGRQDGAGVSKWRDRFARAGIETPDCADVRVNQWTKFVLFNAMSSTTAAARTTLGTVRSTPALWDLFADLARETEAVARAQGIDLPADVIDTTLDIARALPPESRASTAHDLAEGRPLETDFICGAVVRRGNDLGVPTPKSAAMEAILAPWKSGKPA